MLILSRRSGESVLIGDNIRIIVLATDRRGVRIGIEAPSQVNIVREEIRQQDDHAKRAATAENAATSTAEPVIGREEPVDDNTAG